MVAREIRTGRLIRLWCDELPDRPPFPVGDDSLVIAYALISMIPLAWIVEAKLVLNDELMKRGAEQRAARLASEQQTTD